MSAVLSFPMPEEADSIPRAAVVELIGAWIALDTALAEVVRDTQEAETRRQELVEQLRDIETQRTRIDEASTEGTCPICARPLGTHFRSVLEVLDTQIESITVDGKYFRARIAQLADPSPDLAPLLRRRLGALVALLGVDDATAITQSATLGLPPAYSDPLFQPPVTPMPDEEPPAEDGPSGDEAPPLDDDDVPLDDVPFDEMPGDDVMGDEWPEWIEG